MHRAVLVTVLIACGLAGAARGAVTLIGRAAIPGDARDRSGLTATVGGVPHDLLGGFGSAIDYAGKDDLYLCAADRGPGDGAGAYRPRVQTFRLRIDASEADPARALSLELVSTTLLIDERGGALSGLKTDFNAADPRASRRFDAEGLRITPRGTWLISDEYGPWIDEFSAEGRRLRRLPVPERYLCPRPAGDPKLEAPPHARVGREPNRGFEGLALSPDGRTLWAVLQSPLIQDASRAPEPPHSRAGRNVRILELPLAGGQTRDLVYQMDSPSHGVSEVLAVDDRTLIVLERDGKAGARAGMRALYLADLRGATDVSSIAALPAAGLPEGVAPVRKRRLLDFLDPAFGLAGETMPEKIEGVTFGPDLPDGRRTLAVTSDNDVRPDAPSWFWVFAMDAADLSAK